MKDKKSLNLPKNDSVFLIFNKETRRVAWFDTKKDAIEAVKRTESPENFTKPIKYTLDF